jgi:hypothetical protein
MKSIRIFLKCKWNKNLTLKTNIQDKMQNEDTKNQMIEQSSKLNLHLVDIDKVFAN